jgi:Ca-activated chloride channel family protein
MKRFDIKDVEGRAGSFDLTEVRVSGNVCGEFVEVSINQTFKNNSSEYIEGVYSFPIPDTAIISGFEATIGGRRIQTIVEDREKASQIYEDALKHREETFMLDEIMPHHFRITMGKIIPGETINIKLSYIDDMEYNNGVYKLVIPYIEAPQKIKELNDENNDRADSKLKVNIMVESLCGLQITSPSNKIEVMEEVGNLYKVTLSSGEIMEDDFILLFKEKEKIETAGMIYEYKDSREKDQKNIVYLRITPDIEIETEERPNNYIFLIDTSKTMEGAKLQEEKNAVLLCLRNLSPEDTFDIVAMGDELQYFSEEWSLPFNDENLKRASKWIKDLTISEDAALFDALKYSLVGRPSDNNTILLFTDDIVEDDEEKLNFVQENIGNNRIFTFGIDTSVNSYFITKLAQLGYGRPEFIYPGESIEEQVLRQFARIENPQVDDVEINWGSMKVISTYPRTINYMFDGEPLTIFAECEGDVDGEITINGSVDGKKYLRRINLDNFELEENASLINKVWCRKRIESIEERIPSERGEVMVSMKNKVVELSKRYGIISPETTFVMLDEIEEPVLGMSIKNIIPVKIHERTLSFQTLDDRKFMDTFETSKFIYKPFGEKTDELKEYYSRKEILRILAENQFADGAFIDPEDTDYEDRVETTAMILLGFTLGEEDITVYINQIRKAVEFILKAVESEAEFDDRIYALIGLSLKSAVDKGVLKTRSFEKSLEAVNKLISVLIQHKSAMVKDIERFNKEGMLMNEVLSYFKDYEGGLEPSDLKNYSKKSIYALAKLAVMELYK